MLKTKLAHAKKIKDEYEAFKGYVIPRTTNQGMLKKSLMIDRELHSKLKEYTYSHFGKQKGYSHLTRLIIEEYKDYEFTDTYSWDNTINVVLWLTPKQVNFLNSKKNNPGIMNWINSAINAFIYG